MSTCKWYSVCPIKKFTDQGKLENCWVHEYCLQGRSECIRYQKQERGEFHPDNMLPNGEIRKELML